MWCAKRVAEESNRPAAIKLLSAVGSRYSDSNTGRDMNAVPLDGPWAVCL